ncbi:MAG: helix-turn-helix domain-containing protein [Verrucomicrobiota bacterium]|nr:MAG: helix-turn-helix domain-containing protein [Verrucomicrobiota bacterium]
MSEGFGSRLKEARERKGLSLDDVAEAIRVKIDYLESIENGSFDFDLPDIYKRGFYKSYVDFLGLDVPEMMAMCPVPAFETIEAQRHHTTIEATKRDQQAALERNLENIKTSFTDDVLEDPHAKKTTSKIIIDRQKILKIAGIVGGIILLLGILGLFFNKISSHSENRASESAVTNVEPKQLRLHAKDTVRVMVREEESRENVFTGTLAPGEQKNITYQKPIAVYYDRGEVLEIELMNGEILHLQAGRGGFRPE